MCLQHILRGLVTIILLILCEETGIGKPYIALILYQFSAASSLCMPSCLSSPPWRCMWSTKRNFTEFIYLFVGYLMMLSITRTVIGWQWVMNWKWCTGKGSAPNLRYYSGVSLEVLRIFGVPAKIRIGHLRITSQEPTSRITGLALNGAVTDLSARNIRSHQNSSLLVQ
jgi:hypothetical protein